ncbi:MAG: energy transducer TonB [Acidobacteria bacterium]|nr:energy transducer TonB [Acidobacteriota bacterium]
MNRMILIFAIGISFLGLQNVFGQISASTKTIPLGILNEKVKFLPLPSYPRDSGQLYGPVQVIVRVDLPKGQVVSAKAVSGHPFLRPAAVAAALEAVFQPILEDFGTVYGDGVLVYRVEEFNRRPITNAKPKPLLKLFEAKEAIINGKALILERPDYSAEGRSACAKGKVEILTLIHGWRGEVISAKAISGDELLFDESEKAVLKSKFAAFNIDGDKDLYFVGKIVFSFDSLAKCLDVGVVNKKALSIPRPQVRNLDQINKEEIVTVKIVVDLNGRVIYAKAISGHPLLREECVASARQAKFSPAYINGPPIQFNALLVYRFKPDGTIAF